MRVRGWARVVVICVFLSSMAPAVRGQDNSKFFPLNEIKPGLKGVGRTIFEGDKIEEFQVEFLGVLKNVIGPKHDVILARLSGGPLEKTGVIAGMSGSPVYVDGRLVGAVALSFPFSKDPIAGITPIQEMLDVVPGALTKAEAGPAASNLMGRIVRVFSEGAGSARLIPNENDGLPNLALSNPSNAAEGQMAGLRLPLSFGGFSPAAIENASPLFRQMGFEPMEGTVLSSGSTTSGDATAPAGSVPLPPGSMISVLLVRGDLNLNVDCTVTYLEADKLFACGHRFLLTGPVSFPMAKADVLVTVPNLSSSFKVDTPGQLVGSIHQDRFGAIYGTLGDKSPLIPVHIHLDSTLNKKEDYNFSMVQETFLSPLLLNLGLVSTLSSTERMVGPSTLELTGKIRLSSGDSVDLEDVLSGDFNTGAMAGLDVSGPLSFVLSSGFPDVDVKGIDLSLVSRDEKRLATLDQVWATKSEVRPGDHIEVSALLRTPWGESVIQKIPVDVPESVNDKTLSLVVGSGASINALQNRFTPQGSMPRDLHQLVRALNRMRRNNRVYALLMSPQRSFILQGDEYPSPPPSLMQTLLADPAVAGNVVFSGTSVVGDFETKPCPYAIQGQKTLMLKVLSAGK
ncbi:MAG TPA: SpoIVB peptidase S55 domain-containing protein [Terriglobia bacterium]|nr:SpoIVB peptidase S55 domain-containing protein [Terriglobia bacterium]